jgi:hypothetical protein
MAARVEPILMSGRFFEVQTTWGSTLQVRHEDGLVIHRSSRFYIKRCSTLFLYISDSRPDAAFLIPHDNFRGEPTLFSQPWPGRVKALRLETSSEGSVALVDFQSGRFASARELDPTYHAVGALQIDNTFLGPWETFQLVPRRNAPAAAVAAAAALDALLCQPDLVSSLKQALIEGHDRHTVHACSRLLDVRGWSAFADWLADSPEASARLAAFAPDDVHATRVLPRLSSWLRSGRPPEVFPQVTSSQDDALEAAWFDAPPPSLAAKCVASVRATIQPTRSLAVLASVRNEGLYLVDWLAHHRALGVQAFFIYTNDNDDGGSAAMLQALAEAGEINLVLNEVDPTVRPQYKAYGHALQALPELLDYAWVAAIDADEFLDFNAARFTSFADFLSWQEELGADSIALSWLVHTPNGHTRYVRRPVQDRFPKVEAIGNAHVKSIFRPNRFIHADCHFPVAPEGEERRFFTAEGTPGQSRTPFNHAPNYHYAWVGHYYYKSIEEYLVRRMRNRGNAAVMTQMSDELIPTGLADMVVRQFNAGSLPINTVNPDRARRTSEQAARLRDLPGVSAALEACEGHLAGEAERVRRLLSAGGRFTVPGSPEAALLALLECSSLAESTASAL